jgi:hypothetical protein
MQSRVRRQAASPTELPDADSGSRTREVLGDSAGALARTIPAGLQLLPAHEQVEQAWEMLGDHVEDVLSPDRPPHLLQEFYASIGLCLTRHHDARRLCAELDLGPVVADVTLISKTPTNRGIRESVRGGT